MLNQRKPKSFNYESRYSKDDKVVKEPDHISKREIQNEWLKTRRTGRGSQRKTVSRLLLLLALLVGIVMLLFYLENQTA